MYILQPVFTRLNDVKFVRLVILIKYTTASVIVPLIIRFKQVYKICIYPYLQMLDLPAVTPDQAKRSFTKLPNDLERRY